MYCNRLLLALAFLASAAAHVAAQSTPVRMPAEYEPERQLQSAPRFVEPPSVPGGAWSQVEVYFMPLLDLGPVLTEDLNAPPQSPNRIGINRAMPEGSDCNVLGRWSREGGRDIWRMRLRDPGAQALRIGFDRFALPDDGVFVVGDREQRFSVEFDSEDVQVDGWFWTPPIPGEEIYLEYSCARRRPEADLRMKSVAHLYAGGFQPQAGSGGCVVEPCHVDVVCDPNIGGNSVGRMLYSSGSGTFTCSGSLMNDAISYISVPYFLTANHCLSTQSEASSLNVTFFFQSSTCGGSPPNPASLPQTNGSTLLETTGDTDMTLLQLSGPIPGGVTFAGWSTGLPFPGEVLRGVHHPASCRKRVSVGEIDLDPFVACSDAPLENFHYGTWASGHTEGGSSGSPLFNSAGLVIGQLFGTCSIPDTAVECGGSGDNWLWVYGRFDKSFDLLRPYLLESGAWVDFSYSGTEVGSPAQPFNTVAEALQVVPPGGRIWFRPGSTPESPLVDQSITFAALGGPVTLGL